MSATDAHQIAGIASSNSTAIADERHHTKKQRAALKSSTKSQLTLATMPLKAVKTAKFAVLDAGSLKPAKAAPRSAPA